MLKGIQDFFRRRIEPGLGGLVDVGHSGLRLATAALLVEMMRMDRTITDAERDSVAATLIGELAVEPAALEELLALAAEEASAATDYFQFTSLINRSASPSQKVALIESLWRVAFADGHLDDHEAHLLKKIAGLLHVPHAEYVNAKSRARDAASPKA